MANPAAHRLNDWSTSWSDRLKTATGRLARLDIGGAAALAVRVGRLLRAIRSPPDTDGSGCRPRPVPRRALAGTNPEGRGRGRTPLPAGSRQLQNRWTDGPGAARTRGRHAQGAAAARGADSI